MTIARSSEAERQSRTVRWRATGWTLVALVAGAVVAFPLLDLGREVALAGWESIREVGGSAAGPISHTLWTSLAATAIVLVTATALALVAASASRRQRLWIIAGVVVPLLIPPFVSAVSWLASYGPGGLVDDTFGLSAPWLAGPVGIVLLLAVSSIPIAFLVVLTALESRQERDLTRAARLSGADPIGAFLTVTLPLLRPALVAAGAVTFIVSVNAFGVPVVLGTPAGFGTATTRIYQDLVRSADPAAFDRVLVLAAVLAVVSVVAVAFADRAGHGSLRLRPEPSGPQLPGKGASPVARVGVAGYVLVTAVVPLLALVLSALTQAVGLLPVPSNWTLENFRVVFAEGAGSAALTSFVLGVVAATVVVSLGGLLVSLERRRRSGVGTAAALSFALPGSVLAVAVLLAYGSWLRDTVLLILIAYVAKFWALGHRPIAGSADAISPDQFGAARVSGASGPFALRSITIPLLRPAIVAAWLLVLMFAVHELTMSSLLHGPGSRTLAVAVLDLQQLGDATLTAALATTLTLGSALVVAPLLWLMWPAASRRAS